MIMNSMKWLSIQKKQVLILYFSTFIGTILGVLASVVNTRALSPSDYGDVRYVQNIINLMASLLMVGYFVSGSRLLALSQSEEYSRKIRGCLVVILIIVSILLMFGTGLNYFFHLKNEKMAILFLLSMPICFYPLLNSFVNTTSQGDNHIARIALVRILPVGLYVPIAYTYYQCVEVTSYDVLLLQWGIYNSVILGVIISSRPDFKGIKSFFKVLNKENKDYGFHLYIGSLVMVATNYLAGITLGLFNQDNVNVGFYTLALTVTTPLAMLPAIIGTTYFKQFAKQDRIPDKVLKATILMTVFSCLAFIAVVHPVVEFLYSDSYRVVGTYASYMAVGFSMHGIGDMINRYLGSHGQGKVIRNSSIICGIIKIIGFTLFVYLWNINGAIAANILSSLAYAISLFVYYYKYIQNEL